MTTYRTPGGRYSTLYYNMAQQPHLLIAGATGSGKSVVVNGIIHALLTNHSPASCRFILIDPKRVELVQYKALPHTLVYASADGEPARALKYAVNLMEERFADMQKRGLKKYDGSHVYVIIDELADLMLTDRKLVQPLIQRISQLGRACLVHQIACTQSPICQVIPTVVKCNLDSRVGLRTRSAQGSRNILGVSGCETLPRYGQGYYMTPEGLDRWNLPMIPEEQIDALVKYWTGPDCRAA